MAIHAACVSDGKIYIHSEKFSYCHLTKRIPYSSDPCLAYSGYIESTGLASSPVLRKYISSKVPVFNISNYVYFAISCGWATVKTADVCCTCSLQFVEGSVQCVVCCVQCIVCHVLFSVFSVHFAIFNIQCAVCRVQCVVYSVRYAVLSVQYAEIRQGDKAVEGAVSVT